MDEYKIETIFTALIAGITILWRQLNKQVSINRDDQKEFLKSVHRTIEVVSECNELMRDLRDILKDGQKK